MSPKSVQRFWGTTGIENNSLKRVVRTAFRATRFGGGRWPDQNPPARRGYPGAPASCACATGNFGWRAAGQHGAFIGGKAQQLVGDERLELPKCPHIQL